MNTFVDEALLIVAAELVLVFAGLVVPSLGGLLVLRNAPAVLVDEAELELRHGVALFGGAAVPLEGLLDVLLDTVALEVHVAEGELALDDALFGTLPHERAVIGLGLLNGGSSYDATAAEEAEFNRLMKKKKAKRKRGFHL